ncbi:MAG: hypothetical protein WC713_14355 [Candidatus Methylomirabilota bacterium]
MLIRVLTWLLVRANTKPPHSHREPFYQLKDRLLHRFGRLVGTEWQHIRKTCWSCDDGVRDDGDCCWKCGGTGIYQQTWVLLERWKFGDATFHRPVSRTPLDPHEVVTIHGPITHPNYRADTTEALLWLSLLFDRHLLWGLLRGGYPLEWSWRRPLSTFREVCFRLRTSWSWFRSNVVDPLRPRRCPKCGHHFVRAWSPSWYLCPACVYVQSLEPTADDIPF